MRRGGGSDAAMHLQASDAASGEARAATAEQNPAKEERRERRGAKAAQSRGDRKAAPAARERESEPGGGGARGAPRGESDDKSCTADTWG
eukprot:205557-Prymnesium_polylepis.2